MSDYRGNNYPANLGLTLEWTHIDSNIAELEASPLMLAANESFLEKEQFIKSFKESFSYEKTEDALKVIFGKSEMSWEFFGKREEVIEYVIENCTSTRMYRFIADNALTDDEELYMVLKRIKPLVISITHSDCPCIGTHRMDACEDAWSMVTKTVEETEEWINEYSNEANHQ